jgi:5-formyltetrahydrofolate cyclo-ligase
MGDDHGETKRALRRALRAHPAGHGQQVSDSASHSACERLSRLESVLAARRVVAYAAVAGEIDLRSALDRLAGRAFYWPRVVADGLEFRSAALADMRPSGRYGLREPADGPLLAGSGDGVVFLVPGVAFDTAGTRLGRGAGLYDRALSGFPSAVRIGVTCEPRLQAALPVDRWDVPMHLVVTESRLVGRGIVRGMCKETYP